MRRPVLGPKENSFENAGNLKDYCGKITLDSPLFFPVNLQLSGTSFPSPPWKHDGRQFKIKVF